MQSRPVQGHGRLDVLPEPLVSPQASHRNPDAGHSAPRTGHSASACQTGEGRNEWGAGQPAWDQTSHPLGGPRKPTARRELSSGTGSSIRGWGPPGQAAQPARRPGSERGRGHSPPLLLPPRLWTEGHDRADRGGRPGPREQVAVASQPALWQHPHLWGYADRHPVGAHGCPLLLCVSAWGWGWGVMPCPQVQGHGERLKAD